MPWAKCFTCYCETGHKSRSFDDKLLQVYCREIVLVNTRRNWIRVSGLCSWKWMDFFSSHWLYYYSTGQRSCSGRLAGLDILQCKDSKRGVLILLLHSASFDKSWSAICRAKQNLVLNLHEKCSCWYPLNVKKKWGYGLSFKV